MRRFLDRLRELWRDSFQYQESRAPWRKCPTCPEIHNGGHRCPNRMVGFCADCERWRLLDAYGRRCAHGHESIGQIKFRTPFLKQHQRHS